jgi:hypothetical protein
MIESLKMTYNEIMNMEFGLLLMLQHDKPRVDYGTEAEEVKNVSGQEMLKRKRK